MSARYAVDVDSLDALDLASPIHSKLGSVARTRTGTLVWTLVCAGWLAFIWLWQPAYLTLTVDDSFYVFRTAENIAAGHGVTFDQINPTNGFHPLWMAVAVPLSAAGGGDPSRTARVALSVEVLMLGLAIFLLAKARDREGGGSAIPWVAALTLTSFYSAKALFNGLESALQVLVIAGALAVWLRSWRREACSLPMAWALGALGGLALLARLDAVFFALALCAMPVVWPSAAERALPATRRWRWTLTALFAMGLVVAPYFLYNLASFGHLMPVSGAIKSEHPFPRPLPIKLGLTLASLGAVIAIGWWGRRRSDHDRVAGFARFVFPLAAYVGIETAYNAWVRGVIVPEIWYLAPHLLLAILVVAQTFAWSRDHHRLGRVLATVAIGFAVSNALAWNIRLDPATYSSYLGARNAGEWLRHHTAPDDVIAGWDCGIAAAHSGRRFMNLDGLINSWQFKERYMDRGRVYEFLTQAHPADYVCQFVTLESFDGRSVGGVDFTRRGWNVVYEGREVFRSVLSPWRTRTDVYLVLTRRPGGVPFDAVARRLASSEPLAHLNTD